MSLIIFGLFLFLASKAGANMMDNMEAEVGDLWGSECALHLKYLQQLFTGQESVPPGEVWHWRMMDAAGRFPMDGFLSSFAFAVPGSESGCLDAKGSYPNRDGVEELGNRLCTYSFYKGEKPEDSFAPPEVKAESDLLSGDLTSALVPLVTAGIQAVCIPESCSKSQVEALIAYGVQSLPGQNESEPLWGAATTGCSKAGLEQLEIADYIMIAVVTFFALMSALGTIYSWISKSGNTSGILGAFLMGFSVPNNLQKLFAPERRGSNHISCLNGIRVLSMMWIVFGHCFAFGLFASYNDGFQEVVEYVTTPPFRLLLNAFPSVDNFFLVSGLLVGYLTFKELEKRGGRLNILMFYLHRYLRLTGLYAFVVGVHASFLGYLENGSVAPIRMFHEMCTKYWWRNLLYIQNIFLFFGSRSTCVDVSWYLDNDTQMFLVSPLLLLPMFFLARRRQQGLSYFLASMWMLAFTILVGVLTYINQWPFSFAMAMTDESSMEFQIEYYIQAYCRCLPYIVGITLGFILHQLQGKDVKLPLWIVSILWLLSAVILFTSVFAVDVADVIFFGAPPPGMVVNIYFNSIGKVLYGSALAWVIFACTKGYGGFVNTFLSWEGFTVLGRISFCIYLVHATVIYVIISRIGFIITFSFPLILLFFFGVFNTCIILSLLLSIFVEIPYLNAEKLLFTAVGKRGNERKQ